MRFNDALSLVRSTTDTPQFAPEAKDPPENWFEQPPTGGGGTGGGGSSAPEGLPPGAQPFYPGNTTFGSDPATATRYAAPGYPLASEGDPTDLYTAPSGLRYDFNGSRLPEAYQGGAGGGGANMQVKEINGRIYVFDPSTGQFVDSGLGEPSGGGGDGSATAWAQLAQRQVEFEYQQKQDAFARALDYISAIQSEQQSADRNQQNYANSLTAMAPQMVSPEREHYGGFGPTSGGTLLDLMQGGPGRTMDIQTQALPPPPRPADTSMIERLLGGYGG